MSARILIDAEKKMETEKGVRIWLRYGPEGCKGKALWFSKKHITYDAGGIVRADSQIIHIKEYKELGGETIYSKPTP